MRTGLIAPGIAALLACLSGCVSHGVPTHGGGKRFYYEQQAVTQCVDEALGALDWKKLEGKTVNLLVQAVNDEGGGVDSGGAGLDVAGFFGFGGGFSPSSNTVGVGGGVASVRDDYEYEAHAVANARDIEYVKGVAIEQILTARAHIHPGSRNTDGTVYLLVNTLGIDKTDFSVIVYKEVRLDAKAGFRAFFAPRAKEDAFLPLGEKDAERKYRERSVFGIGLGAPTLE